MERGQHLGQAAIRTLSNFLRLAKVKRNVQSGEDASRARLSYNSLGNILSFKFWGASVWP